MSQSQSVERGPGTGPGTFVYGTVVKTLVDKLWDAHRIAELGDGVDLLHIDRTFLHERTGSVALDGLRQAGRRPARPESVFCTFDHIVSTDPERGADDARSPGGEAFITDTRALAEAMGIRLFDVLDPDQGIVHVISPELGLALPGLSVVCPDSHTGTLGGLGALAWGIGSSDAEHAVATGCLRVRKPPQMRITVEGGLAPGVSAKDIALHVIGRIGASGANRAYVEWAGSTIRGLTVEARLTLCNLGVEMGAFSAIVAPDATVFEYVRGRRQAPKGEAWAAALEHWQSLFTDDSAAFDAEHRFDAAAIRPTVTWGISPEHAVAVGEPIPDGPEDAFAYMGVEAGRAISDYPLDGAFIGSCTNARLSDLRAAAEVLKGRRVADGLRAIVVPGSMSVRRAAEAEGLDAVFRAAGFDWQASGCAFCFYAGGETWAPGSRVVSSTNRNFKGRQGPGVRTHLASPAVVAASAVMGRIAGPSDL